jgi:arylsulfatase A-like enzyme
MTRLTTVSEGNAAAGSSGPDIGASRLGPGAFLLLSAWCGLVAGVLEVATIVLRKRYFDSNQLYQMSRHFVWLIPVTNLCLFVAMGVLGFVAVLASARRGRRIVLHTLCAVTLLPALLVAWPRVYGLALLLVTVGFASWLVPLLERNAVSFRRVVRLTFPVTVAAVLIGAVSPWVVDRLKQSREQSQAMPPPGSPNVLLIVMDTVAAGHLSLHGYDRPTSTSLADLANHGIRFASAQASSSWTLPSHATMFTGRWMHELSVGWLTPLDNARPTLAEYLGAKGYATAGFVANTPYCARDSGLSRGFNQYSDFIFPELSAFKRTVLVSRALAGIEAMVTFLGDPLEGTRLLAAVQDLLAWFNDDRKPAAVVNREFLNWLSGRTQPDRPFFVFLNYFDAHYPYLLPSGRYHRFGNAPTDTRERTIIEQWGTIDKRPLSPPELALAVRAYDDCIADLDEQIGRLTDRLRRMGVLDHTWLIIVSDHGESFGEHSGIFCHGTSLYQTELHVPLVIVPPGGNAAGQVVTEAVSTRDLAATIVDLVGQAPESPFPGQSLARFWTISKPDSSKKSRSADSTLAEVVPAPNDPNHRDRSRSLWPLGAIYDTEWSYIRREGDVREELFHMPDDTKEKRNLASHPAARRTLERMRAALSRMTAGPLLPQRFNP